jgi:ABC-type sugar transport system ATPase subunit
VRRLQDEMRIKAPRLWQSASSLSGGNQQKVVIAKWLAIDPDLLILDEPTRGIDIGTKFELYSLIDGFAERGKAVLLVSSELPEILALADRVLVMRNGAIVAELSHEEANEETILSHAVGEPVAGEAVA